jgi:hypothetical protein
MTSFKSYLGEQLKSPEFKRSYEAEVNDIRSKYEGTRAETLQYCQSSAKHSHALYVADSADGTTYK